MKKKLNACGGILNLDASELVVETRSLPALTRSYPRHFTFYVARPTGSIGRAPVRPSCCEGGLDVGRFPLQP
jgi:hypothetical protein